MNRKQSLKTTLIVCLFFLALGGWLLHLKIHPPLDESYNLVPFIIGSISVFIIPLMFFFRRTMVYAYVLNGFTVIIGTITMTHYSLYHFSGPITIEAVLIQTLLADICLLWGKFAVGRAIFELELLRTDQDKVPSGRYFRFPSLGWWLVHFVALAIVYTLGHVLWQ